MKKLSYIIYISLMLGGLYAANQIDKRHFETAQQTLNSIYKDRVVAQDILFHLQLTFNESYLLYVDTSLTPCKLCRYSQNDKIDTLLTRFKKTSLVLSEKQALQQLEANYKLLRKYELSIQENKASYSPAELKSLFFEIQENLKELAQIQVSESQSLKSRGQRSLDSNKLLSVTEIALMVLLVVVLLFISFFKKFKE